MKYTYRNYVDLSPFGLHPAKVKAFQFGVDEIPKWFKKIMKREDYEIYESNKTEFLGWNDYYTGKFMEVAHTGLYIVLEPSKLLRIMEPEEFKKKFVEYK